MTTQPGKSARRHTVSAERLAIGGAGWVGPRFEPWQFRTDEKENYADYKGYAVLFGGSLQVVRRVEDLVAERRVAATVMRIKWVEAGRGLPALCLLVRHECGRGYLVATGAPRITHELLFGPGLVATCRYCGAWPCIDAEGVLPVGEALNTTMFAHVIIFAFTIPFIGGRRNSAQLGERAEVGRRICTGRLAHSHSTNNRSARRRQSDLDH